ncbi:hypothetical protein Tco_1485362 [Tanacetum coccineum]
MLTYRKTDILEFIGYSDSDFAKCKDSSRSTSGTSLCFQEVIYHGVVVDSISRPLILYCDNSSAVRFSNSTSSTGASLYLETKYLYVQEKVEDNNIVIEYISTHYMLADPVTKGLPHKLFLEHVAGIRGVNETRQLASYSRSTRKLLEIDSI